jgi:hypothetical protein
MTKEELRQVLIDGRRIMYRFRHNETMVGGLDS